MSHPATPKLAPIQPRTSLPELPCNGESAIASMWSCCNVIFCLFRFTRTSQILRDFVMLASLDKCTFPGESSAYPLPPKAKSLFYEKTLLLPCAAFFQPVYKTCRKPRARLGRRRRRERNGLGEEVVPRFCPLDAELIVELVSLPRSGWSQDNTRIR